MTKNAPINQLLKVATVKQPYLNKLKNSRFPQKKKKKKIKNLPYPLCIAFPLSPYLKEKIGIHCYWVDFHQVY